MKSLREEMGQLFNDFTQDYSCNPIKCHFWGISHHDYVAFQAQLLARFDKAVEGIENPYESEKSLMIGYARWESFNKAIQAVKELLGKEER